MKSTTDRWKLGLLGEGHIVAIDKAGRDGPRVWTTGDVETRGYSNPLKAIT